MSDKTEVTYEQKIELMNKLHQFMLDNIPGVKADEPFSDECLTTMCNLLINTLGTYVYMDCLNRVSDAQIQAQGPDVVSELFYTKLDDKISTMIMILYEIISVRLKSHKDHEKQRQQTH